MNEQTLHTEVGQLKNRREFLIQLLERADIGVLRVDVNQALEELDDLLDEYRQAFPNQLGI